MVTALMQPDFGSAVIFGVLVVTMLFVAGTRLAYVALTFLISVPTVLHLILHNTMRWKRFTAFLDPSAYQHDAGFQTINSLAAIANGGIDGIGLGAGQQKVGYIPEAQTDFIVSVIGEELGLIGIALVLTLYAIVFIRGLKVARQAPDSFGQALGFGIILLLAIQVFINFGDNLNLDGMGFAPFGEVVEGMDIVDAINAEYGQSPSQGQIAGRGNPYLEEHFPNLDYIVTATIAD